MPKQFMPKQYYKISSYSARTSLGYLIKRSHALLLDTVEPVLAAGGFTFTQYIVLAYLRDGIVINPKDFCAEFRHDSGALTRVIDQLAERGLLDRARGQQDRRKVDLQLTAAGRKAVEGLIPLVVDVLNGALEEFATAEVTELARLLAKLNNTMERRFLSAAADTAATAVPAVMREKL